MGGDNQGDKTRNMTRLCLITTCFVFVTALIAVPSYFYLKTKVVKSPCHEDLSVPLSNPIFYPNGSVVDGEVYPEGYHFTRNGITRGCLCVLKPCIRKCCAKDEQFLKIPQHRATCVKSSGPSPFDNFTLPVHKSPGEIVEVDRDHFQVLYGDVCVHGKFVLDPENYPNDKHDLMVDGRLRHMKGSLLDVSKYCLESRNGSTDIRIYVCFPKPDDDDETRIQLMLYPIAMIVSLPFLMATIVVYCLLPGLRNLHGKSLVCQCSCLLATYFGLAIIQLKGSQLDNFWCVFLAFVVQFAFLAAFFWLNVMSFDIWWSFSGLRPPKWGLKSMENKKFLFYSLYAWGVPTIITALSIAIDMLPSIPDTIIKPHFGLVRCWFKDWKGSFLYFYLPTGVVLSLNTVMFVTTFIKIRSYTKNDHNKDRFHLYLRLFIVMGLNWILELLSFFVGGPKSLWFVTDISNMLQGVVIFFFFVCKRDILQKLSKKLCPNWNLFQTSQDFSKSLNSSASQTKTDVDFLTLKTLGKSNENRDEETQQHMTS